MGFFVGNARTFPLSVFFREVFPVFFSICFLLFTDEMTFLFSTYLGKVCAIYLIMLYTFIEKFHGMFVCFLFILYYQIFDDRLSTSWEKDNDDDDDDDNNKDDGSNEIPFVSKEVIRIIGTGT